LPLLDTNIVALQKRENDLQALHHNRASLCDTCYIEQLKQREKQFEQEQQQLSWLSWNYADAYTKKYLSKKRLITVVH